jgi:hypothetical protein
MDTPNLNTSGVFEEHGSIGQPHDCTLHLKVWFEIHQVCFVVSLTDPHRVLSLDERLETLARSPELF